MACLGHARLNEGRNLLPIVPGPGFTSLSVRPKTLRRLRAYKVGGMTYDDVLNELMDGQPTEAFWKEHRRRLKEEEDLPWEDVRKKLKL